MKSHSNFLHDLPATADAFGREHFAKNLAHSLVLPNNSPGLVVGIEGEWGTGKSTLIGFITKNLKENKKQNPIVIDFNPWILSTTGALVEALIGQIAASIARRCHPGTPRRADRRSRPAGTGWPAHARRRRAPPGCGSGR